MSKGKIITYVVVVLALLGGAGFLYWDDLAPLVGLGGTEEAVVARAPRDDTPTVSPEEQYSSKLPEIMQAIWNREGAFLFKGSPLAIRGQLKELAITYPEAMKSAGAKDVKASGTVLWNRTEDWTVTNWRIELKGDPVGEIVAGPAGILDVGRKKSYSAGPVTARMADNWSGPFQLLPAFSLDSFKIKKVSPMENGHVSIHLAWDGDPSGFYGVREVELVVTTEGYELVSFKVKYNENGVLRTRSVAWEKDGEGYTITTDFGTLTTKTATAESLVLVSEGPNPARFEFTYAANALKSIAAELTYDSVAYKLALDEIVVITDPAATPPDTEFELGPDFKEPLADGIWGGEVFGWPMPETVAAPADEEPAAAETEGEGTDTAVAEGGAGEEPAAAEGDGEGAAATAGKPTAAEENPAESEEPAASAPRPATPAPAPRPTPARPAATTPATRPAAATTPAAGSGTTTAARPAAPSASGSYDRAVRAYREGRLVEAERQLQTTLQRSPNHAGANYLLGYIYYTRGQYGSAKTYLGKVVTSRDAQLAAWAQQLLRRMGYPY